MLLEKLPKVKRKIEANGGDEPDSKKMKKEDPEEAAEKEKMKKQNKQMFYYRDLLSKHLKKQDLYNLLEHNKQEIPTGEVSTWHLAGGVLSALTPVSLSQDRALDRLSDVMTFGALEPCKECPSGGQFVYQSGVRTCQYSSR